MVDNPDQVIEHSLNYWEECGHNLEDVEVETYEIRQVFDIPPVNLIVTEHKSQIKIFSCCGRLNKAEFPESVNFPVQHNPNILSSAIYLKFCRLNLIKFSCYWILKPLTY